METKSEAKLLLERLFKPSNEGESINVKYAYYLQDKASIEGSQRVSQSLSTYSELLESINLDMMYGLLRYRCDRELYDFYKSKRENGSYHVDTEKRFEMAQYLFEDCMSHDQMSYLVKSKIIRPYDCASSRSKIHIVSEMLTEHLETKVKLDDENKVLFYKDGKSFKAIKNYTDESFAKFLAAPMTGVITDDDMLAALKKFKTETARQYRQSDVIQFNDCYIEKGVCKQGFYSDGFPRFMIKRDVYQAYSTEKTTVHSKALDQLIMNLCNYDETTKERFMDVISTVFLNDNSFKKKYNFSPRIVGRDGSNGKSSFRTVVENAFRSIESTSSNDRLAGGNVCSFETKNLNDDRTTYRVVNSLIAIDGDSSTSQINEDACSIFKQITSGDDVLVRPLYNECYERAAITMMINFSNDFPASSDKSSAYLRRLEYIECEYQILDKDHENELGAHSKLQRFEVDEDWFDEIRSDEAAQYLIEDMIIRAKRIFETREISPASEHMTKLRLEFAFKNDSSLAFLNDFDESSIVGFSVKEIKEKYREWCEDNDLTIMKRKFNETLESKGLIRIKASFKYLNTDSSKFIECKEFGSSVNAWQFSDKTKNEEYFNKLHSENELAYKADKSIRDVSAVRKIDEHLFSDEIKIIKLFVAWMESKNKLIINRPTSDVFEYFEAFISELGCDKISRITFNKVMESFGYRRKNVALNRADLTEEELSSSKYQNAKVINIWTKSDIEEQHR